MINTGGAEKRGGAGHRPDGRLRAVLLTITSTADPATDLGFLLHKHPERVQTFDQTSGVAHVFYPEATAERCTAALLLEVDPIALVRGRGGSAGFALSQYVNDRPYAASSLLAVALGKVFGTAMAGRCKARPELVDRPLPLRIEIPALPCRGGRDLATRLFGPLGWTVEATAGPLDPEFPAWGESPYLTVALDGDLRLADALHHLYVLLPVLDDAKHYWVSTDEVDKLVRAGAGWLHGHPERDLITRRYLAHQRGLARSALDRLAEIDDAESFGDADSFGDAAIIEEAADRPEPLAVQRREAVITALRSENASRVLDLGCGPGALLLDLVADNRFTEIVGTDVSHRALDLAQRKVDRLAERQQQRVRLFQSALTYSDDRLTGFDAAVLMEVIEHIDPPRLDALQRNVFGAARPSTVVVTTPNAEHNVRYETLTAGTFRHRDHRFEWGRTEFRDWAGAVAGRYGYSVRFVPVGPDDPEVGPPTQLAVFTRTTDAPSFPANVALGQSSHPNATLAHNGAHNDAHNGAGNDVGGAA
ncbi:MAG TPA: 3' terminal RNA ribose 2'-O-methyltransferase Hen1 [Mycobacteriales bacterium]|jgi:3' terminal RNA ribose 2'-O-methyltransferase Hen1|nr:3' terminal RNA ribose 2'-O-methyltransferase Hen1 [Mycobacteriales bacterium]